MASGKRQETAPLRRLLQRLCFHFYLCFVVHLLHSFIKSYELNQELSRPQNVSISDSGIRKTVDLDPSYDALMNDVEMSLLKHRSQPPAAFTGKVIKEAEYYPAIPSPSSSSVDSEELQEYFVFEDSEHLHEHEKRERKSPAAAFGSKQIGSVILPDELQEAISKVIVRTSFLSFTKSNQWNG